MNALDALGFPEEDDRVVEQDGRLGFMTCTHEADCDDMFALIGELASRGETWEIQFRIDVSATSAIFHTLSRYRPIALFDGLVVYKRGRAGCLDVWVAAESGPAIGSRSKVPPSQAN